MTDTGDEVTRTVGGAGPERVVTVSRSFRAAADEVWDACTNPERIPRWFLPVTGELRPGGRYQLEGNAGGAVERCAPPRSFAVTWEFGAQVSRVAVTLTPAPDGATALNLAHTVPVDDHWREFGPGAVGIGWEMVVRGLAGHLAGDPAPTPDEFAAWSTSADGHAFVARSGDGWHAADLASGTDAPTARAAADRTVAAYTAVPDPAP